MGKATGARGSWFGEGLLRILLDHCVPAKLGPFVVGHDVVRAAELGLEGVSNGKLLAEAESLGFGALITIDKRMRFQQPMEDRQIACFVLDQPNSKLEFLLPLVPRLLKSLERSTPGQVIVISEA